MDASRTTIEGDRIETLWQRLARAIEDVDPHAPPSTRLEIDPWRRPEVEVQRAWAELTAPRNLAALRGWSAQGLNPTALRIAEEAIRQAAQRRSQGTVVGVAVLVLSIVPIIGMWAAYLVRRRYPEDTNANTCGEVAAGLGGCVTLTFAALLPFIALVYWYAAHAFHG